MAEEPVGTFLFADLAGFTALTEAHGDEDAANVAADFFACVRALLPEYGAQEVKTIGDAVMVRCDRAADAIELGLRIADEVGKRSRFPTVRIGMHTGPAAKRGRDWFGTAVNIAARVAAVAGGDQVLISGSTQEAAGELAGIKLRRHGQRRFRHVHQPVDVYRAARAGEEGEGLPVDPVCRMSIDRGQAVGSLTFEGMQYFFCSLRCVEAFSKAPEQYVGAR